MTKSNDYGQDDEKSLVPAADGEVSAEAKPAKARKTVLRVLADHPELSAGSKDLLRRHRTGFAQDHQVEADDGVLAHYQYYAALDPSHPDIEQPPFHLIPMPIGGLDTVVKMLIGGGPRQKDSQEAFEYKQTAERLRGILYRMNTDSLRSENRYRVGALLRVPYETTDVDA